MTAGSGIIHQEMPQKAERMLGSQLWINLPQADKMTHPVYRDIRSEQIPVVKEEGVEVRVISGTYAGTNGPEQGDFVKTIYLDVKLEPKQSGNSVWIPERQHFVIWWKGQPWSVIQSKRSKAVWEYCSVKVIP